MALYPNQNDSLLIGGATKSHTGLVVSEGAAPAEQFTVSKTNKAKPFIYEYGPEGNQTIVIAKGKIVEAVGEERNPETGFKETAIKVAEEGTTRAIGVNHHNVSEQRRGRMEGNRPTVLTRSYIEVPLFEHDTNADTAATSAAAMHFGAAYGTTGDLKSGDFVVVGKNGNFKKLDEGTEDDQKVIDSRQIIGQVLNVTRDLPPAGLLQYYTGLQNDQLDEYLKAMSAHTAGENTLHPYGSPYTVGSWRKDFITALGGGNLKGIPFLTDGYFSAQQQIEVVLTDKEKVEAVRPGDGVTVDGATITVGDVDESMVVIKLKHDIDHRNLDKVSATIDSKPVSGRDLHVDVSNNSIVLYVEGGQKITDLKISVPAIVNPTAGIPTEWDYKGSVGAARILLQR